MPRRFWFAFLGLVPMFTGCFHFRSLPPEVERPLWRPSDEIPPEQKNCVYTFVLGTLDLFDSAHAGGLRDYLNHLGFVKTYYGQSPHLSYFAAKMREIAAHCPTARFAIVGYDTGAIPAAELALEARKAGIPLDLLVFLEPRQFHQACDDSLASHVITIRAGGGLFGLTPTSCGELVWIEDAHCSSIPKHAVTVEVMERELCLIAMGAGLPPRMDPPKQPLVEPMPPPRNKPRRTTPLPAEWRFLEPYGGLAVSSPAEYLPEPGTTETLPVPRVVDEKVPSVDKK